MAGVALVAAWFFFRAMVSVSRGMAKRATADACTQAGALRKVPAA